MINIALIDDHSIFLDAIEKYLTGIDDFSVKFKSTDAESFIDYLNNNDDFSIDILLLDLKLKTMSGLECLDYLHKNFPDIRVIIVSMFHESPFINEAIKRGAMSFVSKDIDSNILVKAIRSVHENGFYIYEELSKHLVENLENIQSNSKFLNPVNRITKTEFEVLQYICQGYTASEIGELMNNSKRTIEGHKQRLLDKTDKKNTVALVAWAFREGIVS